MKVSKYWRGKKERDKLTGTACNACGERFITPRLICPTCHHEITQLAQHIFPTLPLQPVSVKKAKTLVSVIILSYNSAETIRATLSSILEQDLDEPYKIIVIDNSDDHTPDIITQEFPQARLIHNTERIDPGTARNLGITLARGEIIAFLDADCIAPPDWLSRMLAAQRAGHLVVGGSVENGNPEKTLAWASYLNKFQEFIPGGEPRLVYHAPACNISYHRSIFSRFGGFPTTFYPQEDLLFHWRLAQQGIGLWFDPGIQVKHTYQTAWRPYLRQQRRSGLVTAQVLELTDEKGAFLARSSLLALLTMPLLPIIKFLRTVAYFISTGHNSKTLGRTTRLAAWLVRLGERIRRRGLGNPLARPRTGSACRPGPGIAPSTLSNQDTIPPHQLTGAPEHRLKRKLSLLIARRQRTAEYPRRGATNSFFTIF